VGHAVEHPLELDRRPQALRESAGKVGWQFSSGYEDGNSMARGRGPGIEDDERYEMLSEEGANKEEAARIATAGRSAAVNRSARVTILE
jgi:hypothetical protein